MLTALYSKALNPANEHYLIFYYMYSNFTKAPGQAGLVRRSAPFPGPFTRCYIY